ncbi:MAG TPA: hypothetical protein VFP12_04540 [Allosphingosinicella sp.]|nr:hypothetical protein [Allosphingosinicella sp.]
MSAGVFNISIGADAGRAARPLRRALGEGRSDEMRLRIPRVKQVQSDDGSTVLTYEGLDISHDLAGENYLFRTRQGSGEVEISARVAQTSAEARKHAADEGVDYSALSLVETIEYQTKIATKYGRRPQVILFEILGSNPVDIQNLSRDFCSIYLDLTSSYKYNHPDYPLSGEGYYPDEVYFCPLGVDKMLYMTVRAGEKAND